MSYTASDNRYEAGMNFTFCGKSGLQLPTISLGLWHNFGEYDDFQNALDIIRFAFDKGITHFDLANNYGPGPGAAEITFGKVLKKDFARYRDEMIISTKAGYKMWEGPYQDGGSRKYLIASLNQSLRRMNLDYVDIFYSHRYDPQTPIEETVQALTDVVKQGKALYAGISNYPEEATKEAIRLLNENKTPCLIYQGKYNMFVKQAEAGLFDILSENGTGYIAFSPLAQGILTDKYLTGIPENSRAANPHGHLQRSDVKPEMIGKAVRLNEIAKRRNQTLSEMAISWVLSNKDVTSALVGVSSVKQLQSNIKAIDCTSFCNEERRLINEIIY